MWKKLLRKRSLNRRDFGRGFYCTVSKSQAKEWAHRLYIRKYSGGEYIYQYVFRHRDNLKIKRFTNQMKR